MNIVFKDNKVVEMDDVRITHRNFAGEQTPYNRKGDRNFSVVIDDQEIADALIDAGFNVKIKEPLNPGDDPFMFLKVNVKFNGRGPSVYLKVGDNYTQLNEDTVACLDDIDIEGIDLDIRGHDWDVSGRTGRSAYLQSILVIQRIDRFAARFV